MDLKYRILWFDDQPDQVNGVEKKIAARLDLLGLSLEITWVSDFDEEKISPIIASLRHHSAYDMIMVDYDLGMKCKGDVLLRRLRSSTNGEMIFYSAKKVRDLRLMLVEQNVDGVYCLCRDHRLGSEVYAILESTLRRFFHPNYMRGLVVGSVSEMDSAFSEVIPLLLKLDGMPSEQEVLDKILKSERTYLQTELAKYDEQNNPLLSRKLKKVNLYLKHSIITELLERHDSRIAAQSGDTLRKFMDEINTPRIEFAHAKTEEHDGLPVFKERNGKIWSQTDMKALLRKIREHKNAVALVHGMSDNKE